MEEIEEYPDELEEQHDRECDEADNYNKKRKEDAI